VPLLSLETTMLRLVAVGVAIPTIFAAWAGTQLPTAQAAQDVPADRTTVVGCLARQTADGAAPTPEQPRNDAMPFMLTRARLVDVARTAVPGTSQSTNDTGTIAGSVARAPNPALVRERSFTLAGGDATMLAKHVGQRVEIVGTVSRVAASSGTAASGATASGTASASPQSGAHTTTDTAHPSAPAERLTVVSFRPVGGACL
jgi:hypothetical protein